MGLLAIGNDAKTVKGETRGYLTGVLYLAPGNMSGREFCPNRTPGCSAGCLFTAGRGRMSRVYAGRMRKARLFLTNPRAFVDALARDIAALVRKAERSGMVPVVRLNGTSDLPWENLRGTDEQTLPERFPDVQFYDYTKNPRRMRRFLAGEFPANYHLTFSHSEANAEDQLSILAAGGNVAVPFSTRKGEALPESHFGHAVIDGDMSDLRFADPHGVVVGLRAKGDAKRDTSGFVVRCA